MEHKPGDILGGKHRLDAKLGEGGFGVVFRGTTLGTERTVAIKLLKLGTGRAAEVRAARFMRELRAIANLESEYTLTLFDYGKTEEGVPFMVVEYVDGEDLSELLARNGPLTEAQTVTLLRHALTSLAEAHATGILHRDIKPQNLRISDALTPQMRLRVLDFGLAKSFEIDDSVTATGHVIGTPRYMSPEQIKGEELTPASDLYALGLVAFEMLLGHDSPLFLTRTPGAPLHISVADPVGEPLREIVNRMLKTDPADRYKTAQEVSADLRELARAGNQDPVAAQTTKRRTRKPRRSRPRRSRPHEHREAHAAPRPHDGPRRGVWLAAVGVSVFVGLGTFWFLRSVARAPSDAPPAVDGAAIAQKISFSRLDHEAAARALVQGQNAVEQRDWTTALERFLVVQEHAGTDAAAQLAQAGEIDLVVREILRMPASAESAQALELIAAKVATEPDVITRVQRRHAAVRAYLLAKPLQAQLRRHAWGVASSQNEARHSAFEVSD